jgi:hypothetical protein
MRPQDLFLRVIPTGPPSFSGAGFDGVLIFETGTTSTSQQDWVAAAKVESLRASTILPLGPDVIDVGIEHALLEAESPAPPAPSLEAPSEDVMVPYNPNPFLTVSDLLSRYEGLGGRGPDVTVSAEGETSRVLVHSSHVEIASWDRQSPARSEDKIDAVFSWSPRGAIDAMGA